MPVTTTEQEVVYTGNGVTTVFPFEFPVPDAESLVVTKRTIASGVDEVLSPTVFSVTGLGDASGGEVTYPVSGLPLSSAYQLVISREVPLTQTASISNQSTFFADVITRIWDRLVMMLQDLRAMTSRALVFPVGEVGGSIPGTEARKGKYLYFDGITGEPAVIGTGPRNIENLMVVYSLAEFYADMTIPADVNYVAVEDGGEIKLFRRLPGASGPEDLTHPDTSKWAKSSVSYADTLALLTDALGAANFAYWTYGAKSDMQLTCSSPGDLSVSYTTQRMTYRRIGNMMFGEIAINCTPTYTTATGQLRVNGLPLAAAADSYGGGIIRRSSGINWQNAGATPAAISAFIGAGLYHIIFYTMSATGGADAAVQISAIPSGTPVILHLVVQWELEL